MSTVQFVTSSSPDSQGAELQEHVSFVVVSRQQWAYEPVHEAPNAVPVESIPQKQMPPPISLHT
jgi:hypothetical protein